MKTLLVVIMCISALNLFGQTTLWLPAGNIGIGNTAAPSPSFSLEIVEANASQMIRNLSSGGYTTFRVYNDIGVATRSLSFDYAGSSYPSRLVNGGPVGESGSITTGGAYPLTFGTNNYARIMITADGRWYRNN